MRVFHGRFKGKWIISILSRKKYGGSGSGVFERDANWNLGLKTGPSSATADQMKTVPLFKNGTVQRCNIIFIYPALKP